nr:MAG TPA: hypothetical protein [Bacteriophage sp.]
MDSSFKWLRQKKIRASTVRNNPSRTCPFVYLDNSKCFVK